MVLFLEGLWLRTGDPLYKALAKRWSKAMLILFAVGVVTGTILSFEMGLLWPEFMATFGDVFGLAFGVEGFSFFIEAIFIAIYVYGWDRLPAAGASRRRRADRPGRISRGSFMVISVNGWMNHPTGLLGRERRGGRRRAADGALQRRTSGTSWCTCTSPGSSSRASSSPAVYAYGWLRGRRDRRHRVGLVVALSFAALATPAQLLVGDWAARTVAERQPIKLAAFEGLEETTKGAPFRARRAGSRSRSCCRCWPSTTRTRPSQGLDSVPEDDRPPTAIVKLSFRRWSPSAPRWRPSARGSSGSGGGAGGCPGTPWFHRAVVAAGPLSLVALIAGWVTTEVGRQPWVVYEVMRTEERRHRRERDPGRLRGARARLRGARGDRVRDAAPAWPRAARGGVLMLPEAGRRRSCWSA